MKNVKKTLASMLAVIVIVATLSTTWAWLSSKSEQVTNTFAGGAITVTLDEAQVDPTGKAIPDGERVIVNNYKYVAGSVLDKDPTPTILKGSEKCYVFLCVENELNELFTTNTDTVSWISVNEKNGKTLYIYKDIVDATDEDAVLNPIFTQVTVSGDLTQNDVASLGEKMLNVTAYAVQSDNLTQDKAIELACEQFAM